MTEVYIGIDAHKAESEVINNLRSKFTASGLKLNDIEASDRARAEKIR